MNTAPRWMPERVLRTSTRVMPSAPSSCRLMAPATGLQKLGQPVPLSNLVSLRNRGAHLQVISWD